LTENLVALRVAGDVSDQSGSDGAAVKHALPGRQVMASQVVEQILSVGTDGGAQVPTKGGPLAADD